MIQINKKNLNNKDKDLWRLIRKLFIRFSYRINGLNYNKTNGPKLKILENV